MSKKENNAKRAAYAAKEEAKGNKVIVYIIAALLILGLAYAVFTSWLIAG